MTTGDEPPIPPEQDQGRARPLDYVGPRRPAPDRRPLPVGAGIAIGFCVLPATAAVWWAIVRASRDPALTWLGLLLVPVVSLVIALVLQSTFGWRGVLAGVLIAFGLFILIPGIALYVICGSMKF
jgi:hypothetical protein